LNNRAGKGSLDQAFQTERKLSSFPPDERDNSDASEQSCESLPVKGMTKMLSRFLSQDRKIKPSSEHFGLTSDII
jgi:hypothetical protein